MTWPSALLLPSDISAQQMPLEYISSYHMMRRQKTFSIPEVICSGQRLPQKLLSSNTADECTTQLVNELHVYGADGGRAGETILLRSPDLQSKNISVNYCKLLYLIFFSFMLTIEYTTRFIAFVLSKGFYIYHLHFCFEL